MAAPIIFLHGFPFNKSCWDQQVDYFKNRYTVHALDLRGHGEAPAPIGPWMIAHFADDLKLYLDTHKIEKAVICGLSMGGYIALHFAIAHSERLAGLVLCDTRADADSNDAKDKRFIAVKNILGNGFPEFAHNFSTTVLGETTLKEKPDLQKQVENIILENKRENVAMALGALASRKDSMPHLAHIACPTLVVVGEEDRVTPPDVNEIISQRIPNAKFAKIERAGHLSNLEQPSIFNRHLEEYLTSLS